MTAPRGRKKLSPEELLGEEGITLISRRCLKMGFVFQPHRIDHGIDGHIELYDRDSGETLSLTLHVQSKARSTFRYESSDRLKFSLDREHVESWLESNVPVIVIISRPARDEAWWIAVDSACRDASGAVRTTVTVDKRKQRFDQSARQELIRLAQSTGHRSEVPAGWAPDGTDADVPAPRCPWPGLAPYTTSEAGLFFGHEALLDEIGERLFPTEDAADDRPVPAGLLAVVGASGSGKSSLLNARVVPLFVQETMWITGDGGAAESFAAASGDTGSRPEAASGPIIVTLTPGQDPLGALAERLAPLAGTAPGTLRQIFQVIEPLGPSGAVSDRLDSADRTRVEPGVLSGWRLARQAGHASAARPGLLVVDQFEELFTLCADSAARQAFVRAVCALGDGAWFAGPAGPMVEDRLTGLGGPQPVRMTVVLGVRADFYTQCTAYPELAWLLGRNQVVVGPMSKAELLATITQPAAAVGIQLDGGLPEQIVHDLGRGGEADALPMLSHALREAWTASGSGRRLTLAAYQAVGGVEGAIAAKAESTFDALDAQAQSETRRIFLRLVVVRADLSPARQRLDRADLLNSLPPAGKRALDALVAGRLLLVDDHSVRIVHEALAREWPRLRDWIEDNRLWLRTRDQLVADADEWDRTGREDSRLYRGARLATTRERLAATSDDDIGRLATAFITASIRREHAEELAEEDRRAQKRTTIRRLRWVVVALVLTTVLAAGAAVYGVTKSRGERDQRQLAISRQLAADSLTMRETDPNLARQLAVLAWETKPTAEARRALFSVLGLPVEVDLGERLLTVARVTAQAPGDLYAVTATSTTAAVWTVGSATEPPRQRDVLPGHSDPVSTAAVSATGTVVATGTDDGTVTVWDLSRAGSPRRTEPLRADPAQAGWDEAPTIALSPDGAILAVGYSDGTVEIWNTGSGHGPPAPVGQIDGHCGAVHAVSFSPTGATFATSGEDAVIRIWATHSAGRPLATLDDRVGANSRNGPGAGATGNDCPTAPEEDSGVEEDRPDVEMGIVGVDPGFDAVATTLVFSPDGALLAAGGDDGAVRLWDTDHLPVPGAKPSMTLDDPAGFIDAMAFDPTGATLATGTEEGSVRLWDVQGSATPQPRAVSVEHTDGVGALAFVPATGDLVTATTTGVLRTSNIAAPGQVRPGHVALQAAGQTPMTATPTGDMVALVTAAGVVEVRTTADPDHPDRVGAFRPAGTPTSLALSPHGDLLAVGNDDGAISLWDVDREAGDNGGSAADVPRAVFSAHDSQVASLAFGRGGATLFSVGQDDPDVAVWRMGGTGQPERRVPLALRDGPAEAVTISPDGRLAAADTGLGVEVWDISDADSPVAVWMTTTTGASTTTFGPDSLLAVGDEADVTLWDLTRPDRPEKRTTIPRAAGSGDYVGALALSGDGRMLAVSGEDGGGPLLWDLTAPTPVRLLNPATDTGRGTSVPSSVVFGGPGAGTLLAAGVDAVPAGTAGIWATEPADLIRRICAEVHIPLTEAGWAAYAGSGDYAPPCARK